MVSEGQQWHEITTEFGFSTCAPNNPLAFDNTIPIIKTGGLRIAMCGDNRPEPTPEVEKQLVNLDVLILPIDGTKHILTYKEVEAIIRKYDPKAVIPAHYEVVVAGSVLSGLKSADGWVQTQHDVRRPDTATIELTAAELSGAHGRVYYFSNHFEEK